MTGFHFILTKHITGTLSANARGSISLPCPCSLKEVQGVGSNANDATIQVGTIADDDGYLVATPIGDSNVPARITSFTGALMGEYSRPHFNEGDVITWLLDFDGAAGAAAADVTLAMVFVEG